MYSSIANWTLDLPGSSNIWAARARPCILIVATPTGAPRVELSTTLNERGEANLRNYITGAYSDGSSGT
jgi:hypothetical protein